MDLPRNAGTSGRRTVPRGSSFTVSRVAVRADTACGLNVLRAGPVRRDADGVWREAPTCGWGRSRRTISARSTPGSPGRRLLRPKRRCEPKVGWPGGPDGPPESSSAARRPRWQRGVRTLSSVHGLLALLEPTERGGEDVGPHGGHSSGQDGRLERAFFTVRVGDGLRRGGGTWFPVDTRPLLLRIRIERAVMIWTYRRRIRRCSRRCGAEPPEVWDVAPVRHGAAVGYMRRTLCCGIFRIVPVVEVDRFRHLRAPSVWVGRSLDAPSVLTGCASGPGRSAARGSCLLVASRAADVVQLVLLARRLKRSAMRTWWSGRSSIDLFAEDLGVEETSWYGRSRSSGVGR
ncbi:hypothetical protein STANM337S_07089 [Streptomyces tanashiensis]